MSNLQRIAIVAFVGTLEVCDKNMQSCISQRHIGLSDIIGQHFGTKMRVRFWHVRKNEYFCSKICSNGTDKYCHICNRQDKQ